MSRRFLCRRRGGSAGAAPDGNNDHRRRLWGAERGDAARAKLERADALLGRGELRAARAAFGRLAARHRGWAEPLNKQATCAYLQVGLQCAAVFPRLSVQWVMVA